METPQLRQIDEHLQHLSYAEKSRATREAKKWMQEAMEEEQVNAKLLENGHSAEAAKAIYQRARLEIINEKISKNRTAFIVMSMISVAVCAILPLMAEDTMQTGWSRRVVLYMASAPIVTVGVGIYLLVLRHERKYITWNNHE